MQEMKVSEGTKKKKTGRNQLDPEKFEFYPRVVPSFDSFSG